MLSQCCMGLTWRMIFGFVPIRKKMENASKKSPRPQESHNNKNHCIGLGQALFPIFYIYSTIDSRIFWHISFSRKNGVTFKWFSQHFNNPSSSSCISVQMVHLLFVFSACGGLRTGSKLSVLTAYFPVLAYGILEKGGLFVAPPQEDCLTGLMGFSTRAGTSFTAYR